MVDAKIIRLSGSCLIIAVMLLISGCTPAMKQMQARFQYDVNGAVGLPLEKLQGGPNSSLLGSRQPTSVSQLTDGNTLYVYRDYWGSYSDTLGRHINRENCDVSLEVNNAGIVVASRAEGPGCYEPFP